MCSGIGTGRGPWTGVSEGRYRILLGHTCLVSASVPPIIGRANELLLLRDVMQRAESGNAGIVVLEGEAGVGKTRLIDEMRAAAAAVGHLVCYGRTPPLAGPDLPFSPFAEALRDVVVWPHSFSGDSWTSIDRRDVVFERVLTALSAASAQQPVLLALEDLHWAGHSSWDLVSYLAANLSTQSLFVIASVRLGPDRQFVRRCLAELRRQPVASVLRIGPLSDDEVRELVGASVAPGRLDEVIALAQGNPFVAQELAVAADHQRVPDTLAESVRIRAEAVGAEARDVLQVISTVESDADAALLRTLTDLADDQLEAALEALLTTGLIDAGYESYRIRHALTRKVIYDDMLPNRRRRWHARIAQTLDDGSPDAAMVPALAHHWHRAGDARKAAPLAFRSGMLALRRHAFPEASRLLTRAADLWPRSGQPPAERVPVLAHAAEAARWCGDLKGAVRLISSAVEVAEQVGDRETTAALLERLGRYQWELGRPVDMLAAYRRAETYLQSRPPSQVLADVLAAHATALMILGEYPAARDRATRAIGFATAGQWGAAEGHAEATLGVVRAHLESADAGVPHLRRAMQIARGRADLEVAVRAASNLSYVLCTAARFDEAVRAIDEGCSLIRDLDGPASALAQLEHNKVAILTATGRYREAMTMLDRLMADPAGAMSDYLLVLRLEIAVARGEAATFADLTTLLRQRQTSPRLAMTVFACEAEHELWQGNPERAASLSQSGLAVLGPDSSYDAGAARLAAAGMRALVNRKRRRSADDAQQRWWDAFAADVDKRLEVLGHTASDEIEVAAYRLTAEADRASTVGQSPGPLWRQARTAWVQAKQPYREAYTLLRLTELALRAGHRERAARSLASCVEIGERLESGPVLEEAARLAAAGRLDELLAQARHVPQAAEADLTQRESQVLQEIVDGATNRQIAGRLFISERTVGVHVTSILRKLQVHNRAQAVYEAMRRGLAGAPARPEPAKSADAQPGLPHTDTRRDHDDDPARRNTEVRGQRS